MAQLKDTVVQGSLRVTDTTYTNNLNIASLTASYAVLTDTNKNLVSRGITDNTTATAVAASTNLITANTLYYHKGNSNIVTVGTISSGTWQGTAIAAAYIGNHSTDKLTSGTLGTARGGTGNSSYTASRLLYTNTATKFATSDAAQFDGTDLTLTGTLTLSKTTDLAVNADNKPALIIGGASTAAHMEIDANEIQAKATGTTAAVLYINNGGGNIVFNPENNTSAAVQLRSTKEATSTTTGALQVSGGVGIAKKLYVGGLTILTDTTEASISTKGVLEVDGGATIQKNLYIGGYVDISIPSNITATNNNVPSDIYNGLYLCDSDDKGIVYLRGGAHTDGHTSAFLGVKNYNGDTSLDYKGILITRTKENATTTQLDGTLLIKPTTGSYTEGIRIYPYSNWSTIMLLANSAGTNTSGVTADDWGIFNNNGTFRISRGSSASGNMLNCDTSNLWTLANCSATSETYMTAALQLRESNRGGAQSDIWAVAPRLSFHWSGRVAAQIGLASNGRLYELPSGGSFSKIWIEGDAVTGAVWNDYAEFRTSECKEFGYVVMETGKDTLTKTTERLSHFAGVTSDTWGFSQGETETAKTPLAVAGRVLVYTYKDRNEYKPGDCVCAAPNGTVDIMTRDEIIQFPDRIVGTVSCVPNYEEWGGGKGADRDPIKVNGRIWIKVR